MEINLNKPFLFFPLSYIGNTNELILNIYQATSKQQLSINSKYNIPDLKVSNYWTCSRSLASLKAVFYLKAFSIYAYAYVYYLCF